MPFLYAPTQKHTMTITFDFDDTLYFKGEKLNHYTADVIKLLLDRGDKVYIVSRRKEGSQFHLITNERARELTYKVDSRIQVIFCNGKPKYQVLADLNSITHYDNSIFELEEIKNHLKINLVLVNPPNHRTPFETYQTT